MQDVKDVNVDASKYIFEKLDSHELELRKHSIDIQKLSTDFDTVVSDSLSSNKFLQDHIKVLTQSNNEIYNKLEEASVERNKQFAQAKENATMAKYKLFGIIFGSGGVAAALVQVLQYIIANR